MLSSKNLESHSETSRRLNKNEQYDRILSVSKDILVEKGYLNLNIDKIISIAGGSKGSIYECFGDKNGLIIAIFDNLGQNFCREIKDSLKAYYKGEKPDIVKFREELAIYDQKILTPYWSGFLRNLILSSIESSEFSENNHKIYQNIVKTLSPFFSESERAGEKRSALYLEILCTTVILNQFFSQEHSIKSKHSEENNTKFLMNYISHYIFSENTKL